MIFRRERERQTDTAFTDLLSPILKTGKGFYITLFLSASIFSLYVYVIYLQFVNGHGSVTGQSTPVGASWGLYVAAIVFFIGVSHVGIAVSAATRLLDLEYFKRFTRIAEMLTMVCLPAAVLLITIDIGRPHVFIFNVMRYGRIHGPFVWSATVISLYLVASLVYLYLSMRRDIALTAKYKPKWARFYQIISLNYKDSEEERHLHDKVLWWMALILIPIMVSVHSVYGFVFGVHASRPGWTNPFMAPYFVLGAVTNGFATLIIVAAVLRQIFGWQKYLTLRALRNMGRFLCWMTAVYIFFSISEYVTFMYTPLEGESHIADSLFFGRFSNIFWPTIVGLLVGYFILLFNQTIFNKQFKLWVTIVGAIVIDIVLFGTRYLIVVPSLLRPLLPFPTGTYTPTLYEWAAILGVVGFAIGAYALFLKVFPMVELPLPGEEGAEE